MSKIFSKIMGALGRTKPADSEQTERFLDNEGLVRLDVIPGIVVVDVDAIKLAGPEGSLPYWTCMTSGLAKAAGTEIVLILDRSRSSERAMDLGQDLVPVCETLHAMAERDGTLVAGSWIAFGRSHFGHDGLLLADSRSLDAGSIAKGRLLAILLKKEELEMLAVGGTARVLASLGKAARYCPYPPWSVRGRASSVPAGLAARSMLARVDRVPAPGLQVWMCREARRLTLEIAPEAADDLRALLASSTLPEVLCFLTEPAVSADSWFVWTPDQAGAEVISSREGGQRYGGSFVLFVRGQTADSSYVVEDGFGVILTESSWGRVRTALTEGTDLVLPLPVNNGGSLATLSLEWLPSTYRNPIDGETLVALGGWRAYLPAPGADPAPDSNDKVALEHVRLLGSEQEFCRAVSTKDCSDLARRVEELTRRTFARSARWSRLLLQLDCAPQTMVVRIAAQGEPEPDLIRELYAAIGKLDPLATTGPISFQMQFVVSPRQ